MEKEMKDVLEIEGDTVVESKKGHGVKHLTVPDGIVKIADYAFHGDRSIENVILPDSVEALGAYAFAMSGLETLAIPEGVKRLETKAFYYCQSLISVTLPSTLEFIGESAFEYCRRLKSIYIPASVKVIEKDAFKDCPYIEFYCEREAGKGWVDKIGTILVEEHYTTDEDYAFDFHRGGVSTRVCYRKERGKISWNPAGHTVHTNITRDEYERVTEHELRSFS